MHRVCILDRVNKFSLHSARASHQRYDIWNYFLAGNIVGGHTVTDLASGTHIILIFIWGTVGIPYGIYAVTAVAHMVQSERDATDNAYVDGFVRISIPGDIAPQFGLVDIFDIVVVALHFGEIAP
jgi:hypothetical protein